MEKYFEDENLNYYYYYFTEKGTYAIFKFKDGTCVRFKIDKIRE